MARIRGRDPERCLVVPVDVGKSAAMALVADHYGEMVVPPFEFALTETGFAVLADSIARAEEARSAEVVRVGVESAGHYHRTLVARLRAGGHEVVELNPAAVKEARAQQLLRRLKSDARDLGAMAELMVRGAGRCPAVRTDALATQAAWVAHRRRKVGARVALANQVIGQLDLVFPGLDGCFSDLLGARAGRVIVTHICDPDRVRRQGVDGLRRFVARRGVALSGPKATQVVEAARVALRLPDAERAALGHVLAADLALLASLEVGITVAEAALGEVLAATPAAILTSLPGVAVVRASNYGAGIGDPSRFPNAAAAYRAAGLVPALYESAGRSRSGQHISREGSVELRQAIIELGRGLSQHEADFRDYRRRLLDSGKPASVAAVAVGHRAHRLAFAMLRDQKPYDRARWTESVAAGMTAMAKTRRAHQNDVTCPPPATSVPEGGGADNNTARRARG
ncbi:MAG TPA: IS110 family transposase [Acidimicrobiales bacterium]|nr:IS110 family transposase [Acidimicrobiales bacterium]